MLVFFVQIKKNADQSFFLANTAPKGAGAATA